MLSTNDVQSSYSSLIPDDYCGCQGHDEVILDISVLIEGEIGCVNQPRLSDFCITRRFYYLFQITEFTDSKANP
jgi:hypothetical protein